MTEWAPLGSTGEFPCAIGGESSIKTADDDEDAPLALKSVSACYDRTAVLQGCSLRVRRGEVFGLLGVNGAGKTTAIHAALGLISLTDGVASILGKDVRRQSPETLFQSVGFFPERDEPYDWLTGNDLFELGSRMYERWDSELCRSLCERFSVEHGREIRTLSKGQVAKLKLLFILARRPELLILDEPTSGLDPRARHELLVLLRELVAPGDAPTTLLSSHNLQDVAGVAGRIGILHEGRMIFSEFVRVIADNMVVVSSSSTEGRLPACWADLAASERRHGDRRSWLLNIPAGQERPDRDLGGEFDVRPASLENVFLFFTGGETSASVAEGS